MDSIHTPWPGWRPNPTGPSRLSAFTAGPEDRVGIPPHELNTNNRRAPSTRDQIAGLLESTSPGSVIRDAGISRALGTRDDCAVSVVTAISAIAAGTKVPA